MAKINFHILSLFPKMFDGVLTSSMISRAIKNDLVSIAVIDIRDFTEDKHSTTDDYQFGGGFGMVMKPEPICNAIDDILGNCISPENTPVVLMTPQGTQFTQTVSESLSSIKHIIIICGH